MSLRGMLGSLRNRRIDVTVGLFDGQESYSFVLVHRAGTAAGGRTGLIVSVGHQVFEEFIQLFFSDGFSIYSLYPAPNRFLDDGPQWPYTSSL